MTNINKYRDHFYIRTYCGIKFSISNPIQEDVNNGDFINVLPRIPRFGGHTRRFLSVAEHSLLTRSLAIKNGSSQDVIDSCLLHDFSEVYLCDVPSPYKAVLPQYVEMEERIQKVVFDHYKCLYKKDEVRSFDIAARYIEAHALMPNVSEDWGSDLSSMLPSDFVVVKLFPFQMPKFYFKWKLRSLLIDLCKRRKVDA